MSRVVAQQAGRELQPRVFMDLVEEAGFPPGVVNMLPGGGEGGDRLVEDDVHGCRAVTITGLS